MNKYYFKFKNTKELYLAMIIAESMGYKRYDSTIWIDAVQGWSFFTHIQSGILVLLDDGTYAIPRKIRYNLRRENFKRLYLDKYELINKLN